MGWEEIAKGEYKVYRGTPDGDSPWGCVVAIIIAILVLIAIANGG